MLGAEAAANTVGEPYGHRNRHLATGHVAVLREFVSELIEADAGEVGEHDLDHGL